MRELGIHPISRAASIPEGSPSSIPVYSLRIKCPSLEEAGVGLSCKHYTGTGGMVKGIKQGSGDMWETQRSEQCSH